MLYYPLQEAAWTTLGELHKKLAWQQHNEDDWIIEAYAAETLIPKAPAQAARFCTRLRNANRYCNHDPVKSGWQNTLEAGLWKITR